MCDRAEKLQFKSISSLLLIGALSLVFGGDVSGVGEGLPATKTESVSGQKTTPELPSRITTLDGKTYEQATLEKVDAYGLLVRFAPTEGGVGVAKLLFRNLPTELRERYGYDPARAS